MSKMSTYIPRKNDFSSAFDLSSGPYCPRAIALGQYEALGQVKWPRKMHFYPRNLWSYNIAMQYIVSIKQKKLSQATCAGPYLCNI